MVKKQAGIVGGRKREFRSFEHELGAYIKFQKNLKGFWSVLRFVQEDCDDLATWLSYKGLSSTEYDGDDSDADSGMGKSVTDEGSESKKPALENEMCEKKLLLPD